MGQAKRNPAPWGGDRVSKTDFVGAEIKGNDTPHHHETQDEFAIDPTVMPIIATHFFGLSMITVVA